MRIKPFQALYPDFTKIGSPDVFCETAKEAFPEFRKQGLYREFPQAAFYIYQMEDGHRKHTGLIALNEVSDLRDGKIKKHEHTIHDKERQQMDLFLQWGAMLKPVLLTYPSVPAIEQWLQSYISRSPAFFTTRFQKDGQIHRMWPVTAPEDIALLKNLFAQHIPATYIADGHHRTTTVALLQEQFEGQAHAYDFEHLFCIFIGADELDILDFNRVVDLPDAWQAAALPGKLTELFDIESLDGPCRPARKYEMILYAAGRWYVLRWKQSLLETFPPEQVLLDVSLLNKYVLHDLLGIHDIRTDRRIGYVDGSKGVGGFQQAVEAGNNRIGFMLFPVKLEDMMRIADAGESLPPKSTYFEPRIRTGVMVKGLFCVLVFLCFGVLEVLRF